MGSSGHISATLMRAFPRFLDWLRLPGFVAWVALSSGVALGYFVLRFIHFASILYNAIFLGAMVLSVCAGVFSTRNRIRIILFGIAGIAAMCHSYSVQRTEFRAARLFLSGTVRAHLAGSIISVPVLSNGSYVFAVRSDSLYAKGCSGAFRHKTIQCRSLLKPCVSEKIVLSGKYEPPLPAENPGAFDDYSHCISNGIWGRFFSDSIVDEIRDSSPWAGITGFARKIVITAASRMRNSDNRAIILASFLNDRSGLSPGIRNIFLKAGIFHLLALSGFHLAIISAALFALLFLIPVPREMKAGVVLLSIWMYLLFIGPIPSLFRAVIMTSVVILSFVFQRKPRLLNSLGIAGVLWLLWSPMSFLTPGYQLSFSATWGIALLYPVFVRGFGRMSPGRIKTLLSPPAKPFFVSLSAFLATAPVIAYHFGMLSLIGILANLFAITLMSMAMWFAMVGFLFQIIFSPVVPLVMAISNQCVGLLVYGAAIATGMPASTVIVPRVFPFVYGVYGLFLIGLGIVRPDMTRRYAIGAGAAAFVMISTLVILQEHNLPAELTLFQINKSSLSGIRWPNGSLWLVGFTGKGISESTYNRVIEPWIRQTPGGTVGAVVLAGIPGNATHALEPLFKRSRVETVLLCDSVAEDCRDFHAFSHEYGVGCRTMARHFSMSILPGFTFAVLGGSSGTAGSDSVTFRLTVHGTQVTFPDSSIQPSLRFGATEIQFEGSGHLRINHFIPAWHPLAMAMN